MRSARQERSGLRRQPTRETIIAVAYAGTVCVALVLYYSSGSLGWVLDRPWIPAALTAAAALVGFAIGRWWVVALPAVALVIAVPLSAVDLSGRTDEPVPPLVGAIVGIIAFHAPAAAVGVFARTLTRRMRRRPRPSR
jgi:hypothetical protein